MLFKKVFWRQSVKKFVLLHLWNNVYWTGLSERARIWKQGCCWEQFYHLWKPPLKTSQQDWYLIAFNVHQSHHILNILTVCHSKWILSLIDLSYRQTYAMQFMEVLQKPSFQKTLKKEEKRIKGFSKLVKFIIILKEFLQITCYNKYSINNNIYWEKLFLFLQLKSSPTGTLSLSLYIEKSAEGWMHNKN